MKTIALNIETEGNPALLTQLPEPDVKFGNTKDEGLKKAKLEKAKQEQLEHMALDPWFGRVLCVTIARRMDDDLIKTVTVFSDDHGEEKLLAWLWKILTGTPDQPVRVVTFNGYAFDIPFLRARSLHHRLTAPVIETGKYKVLDPCGSHFDVMAYLHTLGEHNPLSLPRTLSFYVKQVLGEDWPHAGVDQSKLGELLRQGGRETVQQLCEWNTKQTLVLWELIQRHLG